MDSNLPKYLVTGATGFIGGRLVEKLCLENHGNVRAFIRTPSNAINIGRFPIEMQKGDITDFNALNEAMEGIDTLFHCAHHFEGDPLANQQATANILEAALKNKVSRVIVLSTADVYDASFGYAINEETPLKQATENPYVQAKLAVEETCRHYYQQYQLPVVIIQPSIVYGPWGKAWTQRIFDLMHSGKIPLVQEGAGLCNLIYIDDLVRLLLKAAHQPGLAGEHFIATNFEPVTWQAFYSYFEALFETSRTATVPFPSGSKTHWMAKVNIKTAAISRLKSNLAPWLSPSFKAFLKQLQKSYQNPDKLHPLTHEQAAYFASKTRYDPSKASDALDWQPRQTYEQGFEEVQQWYKAYYQPLLNH